jgi:hypothetical protein
MRDFLTFKSFISIELLIFFYYLGAVVTPLVMFYIFKKYKFFGLLDFFSIKNRVYIFLLFFVAFIFGEIFLRMGFEAIIGYFQMVEALKGS